MWVGTGSQKSAAYFLFVCTSSLLNHQTHGGYLLYVDIGSSHARAQQTSPCVRSWSGELLRRLPTCKAGWPLQAVSPTLTVCPRLCSFRQAVVKAVVQWSVWRKVGIGLQISYLKRLRLPFDGAQPLEGFRGPNREVHLPPPQLQVLINYQRK